MSQNKRDLMAAEFVRKKSFSFHPDEKARHEDVYKVAWDAALKHAPEVQALVEALEKVKEHYNYGGVFNEMEAYRELHTALAKFRAAIQGGRE